MLGIAIIFIFAIYLIFFYPYTPKSETEKPKNPKYNAQMKKLWSVAQTSMRERKPLRAEKALLTILKFDEKNAAAYNRLGILYAKEQKYDEAIECFEIAQSLDNNPSSLHNAGLIYLETGAYEKAAMAFEQALAIEGDLPARYIALAKAKEKLGKKREALDALENAFELDGDVSTLRQILALHEASGDQAAVAATTARIEAQIAKNAKAKAAKSRRTLRRSAHSTSTSSRPAAQKTASPALPKSKTAATRTRTTRPATPRPKTQTHRKKSI